jgi:hypothetical protein
MKPEWEDFNPRCECKILEDKPMGENIIPFKTLQEQAEKCGKLLDEYVSISVSFDVFHGEGELKYKFYRASAHGTKEFGTVQDLQKAMQDTLNPPRDMGVKV